MHWIELGVMLLLAHGRFLLLVVRPLVRRILESESAPSGNANIAARDRGRRTSRPAIAQEIKAVPKPNLQDDRHGPRCRVRSTAQSVQKVGELADSNPNETISIIRSWAA